MLRIAENGRFVIFLLAIPLLFSLLKGKYESSKEEKLLYLFYGLTMGLFFIFVFITRMPFNPRYFMVCFLCLSIAVLAYVFKTMQKKKLYAALALACLATATSNLWVYPEKLSTPWDCSLAHLPYYELRAECFKYLDNNNIEYSDVSSGFSLCGSRERVELLPEGKQISCDIDDAEYYIYSNISNLEDWVIDQVHDPEQWRPIKTFYKWPVEMTICKRTAR